MEVSGRTDGRTPFLSFCSVNHRDFSSFQKIRTKGTQTFFTRRRKRICKLLNTGSESINPLTSHQPSLTGNNKTHSSRARRQKSVRLFLAISGPARANEFDLLACGPTDGDKMAVGSGSFQPSEAGEKRVFTNLNVASYFSQ